MMNSLWVKIFVYLFAASSQLRCITSSELPDQEHPDLEPTRDQGYEHIVKDPGKRTLFGHNAPTHLWGKHVGIHPSGFKYVLGYGPLDFKYVPVVKPVAFLKPVLQPHQIKFHVKSAIPYNPWYKTYFPSVHKPIISNDWRPILKPAFSIPAPVHEEEVKQVFHLEKPVVHVPSPPPPPPTTTVIHSPIEVAAAPLIPVAPPPPLPEIRPNHHYFYFQTPINKPQLLPQSPLLHVAKPNLPVLPFGATFSAPVLQPNSPPAIPGALFTAFSDHHLPTSAQPVQPAFAGFPLAYAPPSHFSASGLDAAWPPSGVQRPFAPSSGEHVPFLPAPGVPLAPPTIGHEQFFQNAPPPPISPPNQTPLAPPIFSQGHFSPPPHGNVPLAPLLPPNPIFSQGHLAQPPQGHAPPPPPPHSPSFHAPFTPPPKPSYVFHGNNQLLLNNQLPLPHLNHFKPSTIDSPQPHFEMQASREYLPPDNFHVEKQSEQFHGIQPGQTDLQFPAHLPHHPHLQGFQQEQDGGHNTFCIATGSLHCRPHK